LLLVFDATRQFKQSIVKTSVSEVIPGCRQVSNYNCLDDKNNNTTAAAAAAAAIRGTT